MKLIKRLIYVFFILVTIAVAAVTSVSYQAGTVSPEQEPWYPFLSLAILPLVGINFLLLILWGVCKNRWAFLPFAMLLLHFEFISAMFQIRLFVGDAPEGTEKIKVITYNVDNFHSSDKNQQSEIMAWIKAEQPDIVCLQESAPIAYYPVDSLKKIFPYSPYTSFSKKRGVNNVSILSKYPIVEMKSFLYPDSGNESFLAVLDMNGKRVRVLNNHLQTTSVNSVKPRLYQAIAEENKKEEASAFKEMVKGMKRNFQMRANQVDSMRRVINQEDTPIIICGDFNDPPQTYTYRTMKGDLTDGFRDCGSGFGYTFRQIRQLLRIDYILYSSDFKGLRYDSPDIDFSDHQPVVWEGYLK